MCSHIYISRSVPVDARAGTNVNRTKAIPVSYRRRCVCRVHRGPSGGALLQRTERLDKVGIIFEATRLPGSDLIPDPPEFPVPGLQVWRCVRSVNDAKVAKAAGKVAKVVKVVKVAVELQVVLQQTRNSPLDSAIR